MTSNTVIHEYQIFKFFRLMVLKNQPYDFVINTMVSFHVVERGGGGLAAETSQRKMGTSNIF